MDDLKEKKEKLEEKAVALATKVYENAAKERQAEEGSTEEEEEKTSKKSKKKNDDDVEEAEYEEK
jgi:hypothetical protein